MAQGRLYYVRCQGRLLGPVSLAQLERMERRGQVSGSDTVSDDRVHWCLIKEFEALHPGAPGEADTTPEGDAGPVGGGGAATQVTPTAPQPPRRTPPRRRFQQQVRPVLPAPVVRGDTTRVQPPSGQRPGMVTDGESGGSSSGARWNPLATFGLVGGVLVLGVGLLAVGVVVVVSRPDGGTPANGGSPRWSQEESADGEVTLGLPADALDGIQQEQAGQNWCWAACVQMVLRSHGFDRTQAEIVRRTFGDVRDAGASPTQFLATLDNWQLSKNGRPYSIHCRPFARSPHLLDIIQELKKNQPVILGYAHPQGGHAVVITAVKYRRDSRNQPVLTEVVVRDPSPSFAKNRGKRILTPNEFNNTIAWIQIVAAP